MANFEQIKIKLEQTEIALSEKTAEVTKYESLAQKVKETEK